MPARPEATRARHDSIADALARERGGAQHVTADDLRQRLNDTHGRIGRWHAEWFVKRSTGSPAPAPEPPPAPDEEPPPSPKPAPARPESAEPAPPAAGRGRPRKAPKRVPGGFLDTDAEERAEERRARQARRTGEAPAAEAAGRGDGAEPPDLTTAAGRLRAALDGTARPGGPERRRVVQADWKEAVNPEAARAIATWLCDRGWPARSREILVRFPLKTTYALSAAKAHALLARALEGSRIVFTGGEWWFRGEKKPRKVVGDSFEQLLLAAAKETLREERRLMSAPELEAAHGEARKMVRKGYLGEALRREAAKFDAARRAAGGGTGGRGAARDRADKKKTAAGAAVLDGGIEKVGEAYRWVPGGAPRR